MQTLSMLRPLARVIRQGHGLETGARLALVLALTVAALFASPFAPAAAAPLADEAEVASTYTVNNNGDAGDATPGNNVCATAAGVCTLRAAIQEANAHAGADTVNIPAMTIVVGSQLAVTQGITINGAGQSSTIIDGNNVTRVLHFQIYSGTHNLSNLTVRKGNYVDNSGRYDMGGGGILNEATLTATNVTVSNSRANQGGGIFNMLAGGGNGTNVPSLTLNSVTLSNNTAYANLIGQGGGGLFNGSILSAQNVTITGNSAYDGGGYYNNSYHPATLNNFTLNNNSASKYGGGMYNDLGNVSLNNGTVSGNQVICCNSDIGAGGLGHNFGTLTVNNVTISNNTVLGSGGYGGGVYNSEIATFTNVTLTGNSAAYGAGIFNGNYISQPNQMTLTNVTISGNIGRNSSSPFVESVGGGIYNTTNARLTVLNSTITLNNAKAAGGIENRSSAIVTLKNTILAANTDSYSTPNCRGTVSSQGNNLVSSTTGCGFSPASGDQVNVNAMLGAMQNNGGSTMTHALLSGSPAIDRGNNSGCPATDQRGVNRPLNGDGVGPAACDIGAFEAGAAPTYTNFIFVPLIVR